MAYRNPLAWNRDLRPGLFKADPNAQLPEPEQYLEEQISPLERELRLQKDFAEIDRMNAELDEMYARSLMPPIKSEVIPYHQCHLIGT